MALTGISLDETRDYVSKHDPDPANPTIFTIGALDPFVRSAIDDAMTQLEYGKGGANEETRQTIRVGSQVIDIVRFGLRGVKNLLDPRTGAPVEFLTNTVPVKGRSYPVAHDNVLRLLPTAVLKELANEISKDNFLTEDEAKN